MAHLAGVHQFRHRAHRLLDRRARVHAVLVVEVDVVQVHHIGVQPLQALIDALVHVG